MPPESVGGESNAMHVQRSGVPAQAAVREELSSPQDRLSASSRKALCSSRVGMRTMTSAAEQVLETRPRYAAGVHEFSKIADGHDVSRSAGTNAVLPARMGSCIVSEAGKPLNNTHQFVLSSKWR